MTVQPGSFAAVRDDLWRLSWAEPARAHREAERLLRRLYEDPASLGLEVRSWAGDIERRARLCHETSTHYKWFVAEDETTGVILWIHQYKPTSLRRPGYAQVAHRHRYWLTSLVLTGGFTEITFSAERDRERLVALDEIERSYRGRGDTYTVPFGAIHSLTDIEDATLTLVVQGVELSRFSEAYDAELGRITEHVDFVGRLPTLTEAVGALGAGGS